jgi:hypothetical protein
VINSGADMPRLTEEEWHECRVLRESTGMSFRMLAERFGVSDVAVLKRARKESWGDGGNANEVANRIARERAQGIVADKGNNYAHRANSISDAADKKAALLRRQQLDWEEHRTDFAKRLPDEQRAAETGQEELAHPEGPKERGSRLQAAKVAAEMLRVRHEGERRAYGITDQPDGAPQGRPLSDFYGA